MVTARSRNGWPGPWARSWSGSSVTTSSVRRVAVPPSTATTCTRVDGRRTAFTRAASCPLERDERGVVGHVRLRLAVLGPGGEQHVALGPVHLDRLRRQLRAHHATAQL